MSNEPRRRAGGEISSYEESASASAANSLHAVGKETLTQQRGSEQRADARGDANAKLDPILEGNIAALASYVPQLATIAVELHTDPDHAGDRAVEGSRLITLVGSLASIIRLAEPQLRRTGRWDAIEPLLDQATALIAEVGPSITTALRAPKKTPADRGADAERSVAGNEPHTLDDGVPAFKPDPVEAFVSSLPRPHVPDRAAFQGIELFIMADQSLIRLATALVNGQAGPRDAGPYKLHAYVREPAQTLLCFAAFHKQRQQYEWMIGPAQIGDFVAGVDLYAGAAQKAYPGSAMIPATMADGASQNPHLPSDIELRRTGMFPDPLQQVDAPSGVGGAIANEHGGVALNAARNGAIRLAEYEVPARRIAQDVNRRIASGELSHLIGRQEAVDQRNQLMRHARERMSPGAAAASRYAKDDGGKTGKQLAERNVRKMLDESGYEGDKLAELREAQAADSEMWARYKEALAGAEDAELLYHQATRTLGDSPLVSKRIIASAARPNRGVTALATIGTGVGAYLGIKDLGELVYDVVTAEEGERLVVASKGIAGFSGGVVGAEMGSAGAAFVASLIPGVRESTLAVTVISLIGGGVGGAVGGAAGPAMLQMGGIAVSGLAEFGLPSSMMSTEGGFEGMHEREVAQNQPHNLSYRVEGAIIDLDFQIKDVEKEIRSATDRDKLVALQKMRIELLRKRTELDDLLPQIEAQEARNGER